MLLFILILSTFLIFRLRQNQAGGASASDPKQKNRERRSASNALIEIDPLTKMHNLRRVDRFFTEELSSWLADGKEVWGIMLDIDKFEEKTRKLTITQGSDLLSLVGNRWKNGQAKDVVARWGGDEFLVISPDEDAQSILRLTEKLQEDLRKAPFYIEDRKIKIYLTATAGISNWDRQEDDERTFQDRLGKLMKTAKKEGHSYKVSINHQ